MSTRAELNGVDILAAILVIVHQKKPIFKHVQKFDESNPYIKSKSICVINDKVRVSTRAKPQAAAILVAILIIITWTKPIYELE